MVCTYWSSEHTTNVISLIIGPALVSLCMTRMPNISAAKQLLFAKGMVVVRIYMVGKDVPCNCRDTPNRAVNSLAWATCR